MIDNIFITGCPKSGTYLLLRAMYAFDVYVLPVGAKNSVRHEISSYHFMEHLLDRRKLGLTAPLVSKRHGGILSHYHKDLYRKGGRKVEAARVNVLNIVRDGRDVFESHVDKTIAILNWVSAMQQRRVHKDLVKLEVRYEDLVANPNLVQEKIAEAFGLRAKHKFSEYPDYVPEEAFGFWAPGVKRPIHGGRIRKDINAYKNIIKDPDLIGAFEEELRNAGYLK